MLGLAIALYVLATPSGLYSGVSTASCLIAGLAAAVVGTVVLGKAKTHDPKADAQRHCTDAVEPADLARVHGVEDDPTHHFPPDQAVFGFSGNPLSGSDHVDSPCNY